MDIVERLKRIAKANFDANKRAGRKGPEWALRNEVTQVAADTITALRALVASLEAERDAAREFVKRHPSLTLIDLAEFEAFLKVPAAIDAAMSEVQTSVPKQRQICDFPNCSCSMGAAERCSLPSKGEA